MTGGSPRPHVDGVSECCARGLQLSFDRLVGCAFSRRTRGLLDSPDRFMHSLEAIDHQGAFWCRVKQTFTRKELP
jgi:hypothetical protein